MSDTKNTPIETLRDGTLSAAIWGNPSEHGTRYSVELSRSYKDSNDLWQNTGYLSNGEILRGSRLLEKAYDRIAELRRSNPSE